MNTWEFDENDELRFTSDSDLELEKVHVWIQNQAMAVRMAVINELIAREDAELERLFGDDVAYTPTIPMQQECKCEDTSLTPEQHIKNAIDKIDEIINEVPC